MSKLGNTINMLLLLKSRKRMKIDEIAEALEIAPRQVRRYRDDLEQAGYAIFSSKGPDGGYELFSPVKNLPLAITGEEFHAMEMLGEELEKSLPQYKREYDSVMAKLEYFRASTKGRNDVGIVRESEPYSTFMAKRTVAHENLDEERKKLDDFQRACIGRRKILMEYTSNTSGKGERTVQPYALVEHEGGIYLIAHCERRDRKIYFKLVRVGKYQVLGESFRRDRSFDMEEHVRSCFGIFEGKEMDVSVKIRPPFVQPTKERIVAAGQTVTDIAGEDAVLFQAKTQGMEAVANWVLSMGPAAEVLGPPELKEEVIRKLAEAAGLYDR